MPINFSQRYSDYARFLPAVSEMYTRFVVNPNPKRVSPVPQSDLDFLNPSTNLWYLPCSLYSAGQAAKSAGAAKRKDMITGRTNPDTTILGDSGGFQIQQGSIKFKGDETRERMMRWLETNCDWSMILDFPTGGINMGTIDAHKNRLIADGDTYKMETFEYELMFEETPDKNGELVKKINEKTGRQARKQGKSLGRKPLTLLEFAYEMDLDINDPQEGGYATCMFQTLVNNVYFQKHRNPGATKFLNVVQGRNADESKVWYEQVKNFQFEGWSLAGPHKEKFDMTLARLLDMRRDGLLEGKDWMHILGVGKLANGCAYTTMQRQIRKYDNPNFTISYDVSSPFTTAAYGNLFLGYTLDKDSWTIQSEKLDGREYLMEYKKLVGTNPIIRKNQTVPYKGDNQFLDELRLLWREKFETPESEQYSTFVETEIGKQLLMKNICVNTDPELTSTWDVVTYALLMNHNVQVHLEAVFESQDLYDKGDKTRVPHEMLELKEVIEEILDPATKDPYGLIKTHTKLLNCLAGDKTEAGIPVTAVYDDAPKKERNEAVDRLADFKKSVMSPTPTTIVDIFS